MVVFIQLRYIGVVAVATISWIHYQTSIKQYTIYGMWYRLKTTDWRVQSSVSILSVWDPRSNAEMPSVSFCSSKSLLHWSAINRFVELCHAIEIRGENAQRQKKQERTKSKLKPTIDFHGYFLCVCRYHLTILFYIIVVIVTRVSVVFIGSWELSKLRGQCCGFVQHSQPSNHRWSLSWWILLRGNTLRMHIFPVK